MEKNEIIIYSSETCPYCKQITEKLEENKIKFTEKLIDKHKDDWIKANSFTGMPLTPTICYKNNYFVAGRDFQTTDHVLSIINEFKEFKHSTIKIVNERLKNLNYNVSMAFQRTDQLLRQIESKLNIEENEHESTS